MASIIPNNATREEILELVQSVIPVTASFQATEFSSFVKSAEENFIFPSINEPMYSSIIGNPSQYPRVYDNLKTAVINSGMDLFSPVLELTIGANGYTDESTTKSKTVSLEKARNIRRHFKSMANNSLENALKLMELDSTTLYQSWKASPQYTVFNSNTIKTSDEFSTYSGIKMNRRVFVLLKKQMTLQEYSMQQIVGKALYQGLQTKSDDNYLFLYENFIKPIIAKNTFVKSLPNLIIAFGEDDVLAVLDNTSSDMIVKSKTITPDLITFFKKSIEEDVKELISDMNAFLADNAELFEEYAKPSTYNQLPKQIGKITRM